MVKEERGRFFLIRDVWEMGRATFRARYEGEDKGKGRRKDGCFSFSPFHLATGPVLNIEVTETRNPKNCKNYEDLNQKRNKIPDSVADRLRTP